MTKLANIVAVALVSLSALIAIATIATKSSPVPTMRLKPTVQQPRWVEVEAEPVYSNPAPLKAKQAPKAKQAKPKVQNAGPRKVVYTQLEQGGSPSAEFVARIN